MRGGVKIGCNNYAARKPWGHAHGFHIWNHGHVGVASIPRGDLITLDGVVFDVNCK